MSKKLLSQVVGGMLAWIDKMITLFDDEDLLRFAEPLNELFRKLEDLDREDDVIIMQIVNIIK